MNEILQQRLDLIEQVELKIVAGDVKRALKLSRKGNVLPDPDQLLLLLLSRWGGAERQMLEALISEEDLRIERAKITKQFLTYLKAIKRRIEKEKDSIDGVPFDEKGQVEVPDYGGKPVILVLYAKEDLPVWQELKKHLFLSLRDKTLQFVDVHADVPLAVVATEAYQAKLVDAARIVLALVTPNSMSVPVFPLAEQALAAGKLIPILVQETDTDDTPFRSDIKGLPSDGRFLDQWPNANSAWVDIAKTLKDFFVKLKKESS
jgi:hypothetical protein